MKPVPNTHDATDAARNGVNFHKAAFAACYGTIDQMKPSRGPEVSFAGRSNVGKSSLLNKLMYRKGLAKVSATPGKTATINFYDVDGIDLVDLPGYGYAQVSRSELVRWSDLIEGYFNQDREFALVVSLIDIRHEPAALDRSMVEFLMEADLPFAIALTKADKISKQKAASAKARLRRELHLPIDTPIIVTSGQSGTGVEELRELITQAVGR
jgi:GTP-binding protein